MEDNKKKILQNLERDRSEAADRAQATIHSIQMKAEQHIEKVKEIQAAVKQQKQDEMRTLEAHLKEKMADATERRKELAEEQMQKTRGELQRVTDAKESKANMLPPTQQTPPPKIKKHTVDDPICLTEGAQGVGYN